MLSRQRSAGFPTELHDSGIALTCIATNLCAAAQAASSRGFMNAAIGGPYDLRGLLAFVGT